jgi:ATP-dependent Lhr-like helicase
VLATPSFSTIDDFNEARAWFATQGFAPFPFQEEVWRAFAAGESGVLHAPRGMGKTYAAALGPIALASRGTPSEPTPLTLLWRK